MSEASFEIGRLYKPINKIAVLLAAKDFGVIGLLSGILAHFPGGQRDGSGYVMNPTGSAAFLSQVGACPSGYDGRSYCQLGSGTNYLTSATAFDVSGTETWISAARRGLTIGGWFYADSTPTAQVGLVSKDNTSPNRGYALGLGTSVQPFFFVSGDGAATPAVIAAPMSLQSWHFIVGRYTPSSELAIFVDGTKTVNTTSIPASLYSNTAVFEIGRYLADNSRVFSGRFRDAFICASALTGLEIEAVFQSTLP